MLTILRLSLFFSLCVHASRIGRDERGFLALDDDREGEEADEEEEEEEERREWEKCEDLSLIHI